MPNANDMNCSIVVVEITVLLPNTRLTLGASPMRYVTPVVIATPSAKYKNPSM